MKKLFFVALLSLCGFTANAYEMAVTAGMQTTEVDDGSGANLDWNAGTDFYAGVLGFIEAGGDGYFRTGALISQRAYDLDLSATVNYEAKLTAIDVPLTYLMMFSEYAGVYGGLKLGLNISEDCSASGTTLTCTKPDAEGMYYSASFGGHFRFVPNFGIEVEYNLGLSDIAKDTEYKSSLAVGVVYLF